MPGVFHSGGQSSLVFGADVSVALLLNSSMGIGKLPDKTWLIHL